MAGVGAETDPEPPEASTYCEVEDIATVDGVTVHELPASSQEGTARVYRVIPAGAPDCVPPRVIVDGIVVPSEVE